MALRIAIGLAITVVGLGLVVWRAWFLYRLVSSGPPAVPPRMRDIPAQLKAELLDVFAQRKLLRRPLPGIAHFFVFWGFIVLLFTIIEVYGDLFSKTFAIPGIGHSPALGFFEDLFAVGVLVGLIVFTAIRIAKNPAREKRASRFYGSHTGAAWAVLAMIFGVISTLLIYRGAQVNTGDFPYGKSWWPFASRSIGAAFSGFSHSTNMHIETTFILLQIAVIWGFFAFVLRSKHMHIFVAEPNVLFSAAPQSAGCARQHPGSRPGEDDGGDRLWHGPDRPPDLEAAPRPDQLHRVRALPGPVPGLGDRQAPLTEAGHHGPARPDVRSRAGVAPRECRQR